MKRMTTEQFIEHMAQYEGLSYEKYKAIANDILVEDEVEQKRDRDGTVEILESDLRTSQRPLSDEPDDNDERAHMTTLEWASQLDNYDSVGWTPPPGDPLDEILQEEYENSILPAALATLSPAERESIEATIIGDQTQEEFAKARGVTQPAVSQAVTRGIARLRKELGEPLTHGRPVRPTADRKVEQILEDQRRRARALDLRLARIREAEAAKSRGEEWTLPTSRARLQVLAFNPRYEDAERVKWAYGSGPGTLAGDDDL